MEKLLNLDQEEAANEMYFLHGYNKAYSDAMRILESKLGKVHTVTVEVRKTLKEESYKLSDKSRISAEKSNLIGLYASRLT